MFRVEYDIQAAQQRHQEALQHARILRLVRAARVEQPVAPGRHRRTLIARFWSALFRPKAARAWR
jgi:hypothetical protein